mmetsp:Transcript_17740/g.36539  ORF Transcript_17740/g.36539 Transcript_17740/m.36539 type:complete len:176 (+) Transcript_17740:353-880(+)
MVLTEEQRERIRKNRERALQIQNERREEKEKKEREIKEDSEKSIENQKPSKKRKTTDSSTKTTSQVSNCTVAEDHQYRSDAPLEDFEEGASEWISKTEAMTMYCLPEGTMAVCSYEEKQNPRNPLFKPMKLYKRSEIRYRAHKRHGGLDGLVKERNKRRQRKLEKDLEEARDIFK